LSADFGLKEIGQISLAVADIDRAVGFYRDVLGMRFLFQAPPGLGFFDLAGVRLMLDAPAKASGQGSSIIYYRVPDLTAAYENLSSRRLLRGEAAPGREAAGPRAVDGVSSPPGFDERDSALNAG
jgi:Glyoxalase/Bleomycin resistance protein/Dioxygenase superfamily